LKSRWLRWSLYLATLVLAVAISVFATLVWSWSKQFDRPPVPLTAGLTGSWSALTTEFNTRVQHRFPIGLPEAELGRELSKQGFSQADWGGTTGSEHEAIRREDNIACRLAARIYWHAGDDGRIKSIRGEYGEEGCL
jgi:hypothetical protein